MYDWIADNLPLADRLALEPIENYRKPELWAIVKQLKGSKNFYVIDKMAEKRGIECYGLFKNMFVVLNVFILTFFLIKNFFQFASIQL